jgi:hypothetical protein
MSESWQKDIHKMRMLRVQMEVVQIGAKIIESSGYNDSIIER